VHLQNLQLVNFRNYAEAALEFPAKITCLVGLNGSGKTNLLDAVYYLSAMRSFLGATDSQLVRHGTDYFSVSGTFMTADGPHQVACQVQHGIKKVFSHDGREYDKLSAHVGKYPVVVIAPTDIDLVRDGSEMRRKFFDNLISQVDQAYLHYLVTYTRILKQRNSLLALFAERKFQDDELLQSYDEQLIGAGTKIAARRKAFIAEFKPLFDEALAFVAGQNEPADLIYRSVAADTDYALAMQQSLPRDLAAQRTLVGIHRDDFEFLFAHGELKRIGSQGQQKSFLIALKLAQRKWLEKYKSYSPILLLDDMVDKLDNMRISQLLERVASETGQVFITDAAPERTLALFKQLRIECDIFKVTNGTLRR
jgi:DNA replication and repair protein RecF